MEENHSPDSDSAADSTAETSDDLVASVHRKPDHSRLRAILFMVVGLAAGSASAFVFPQYMKTFAISEDLAQRTADPERISEALQTELDDATFLVNQKNSSLTYGIFGAVLGITFGALATLALRPSRVVLGLVVGALFGALGGAAGGLAAVEAAVYGFENQLALKGALTHGVAWSVLGIGLGLTFAFVVGGVRSIPAYLFAGLFAGTLGSLLFHPLAAWWFPLGNFDEIVPADFMIQLAWAATPAALFGLFLGGRPVNSTPA